jgi:RHH-type proline utilization regulon transcriptional repressor/proline dehydrogenase/delta 1-pyrroline-5-carboxylate dehydrogenase
LQRNTRENIPIDCRATDRERCDDSVVDALHTLEAEVEMGSGDADLVIRAEALATRLLAEANAVNRGRERRQGQRIARLLNDPAGLSFVLALTDEVMRIRDRRRAARHLRSLVASLPLPAFLGHLDRAALEVGVVVADAFPHVVMPLVDARVRAEMAPFVRKAEDRPLGRYIAARRRQGIRVNLNLLGEAILGDAEAERHLRAVDQLLGRSDVDYVSVKISSVCAQINSLAFDSEVERIVRSLRRLYDTARRHRPAKFVNLDMEEYRDLHLTVAVFRKLLDEPAYAAMDAGIVLQAYLPDSIGILEELLAWATERHRRAGGRIKIRLVKGANLAMEQVAAELTGWRLPSFSSKADVDANYKRLLDIALQRDHALAVRLGVATHNLFEVAWALTLAEARGTPEMIEMEMLEGMAPSMAAAVRAAAGGLLVYAPIVYKADHEAVIAYLVRRFDENTGPENFLRHQFSLTPRTHEWETERQRFIQAVAARHEPTLHTRWAQDRGAEERRGPVRPTGGFANSVDTDFSLPANRAWIARHLVPLAEQGLDLVPAVIAGRTIHPTPAGVRVAEGYDPARPAVPAYRWVQVTPDLVDEAVAAARLAGNRWRKVNPDSRRDVLLDVSAELSARRGRLIGIMTRDGGKTVAEADPEVSEAVDFARYYAERIADIGSQEAAGARFRPYGTVAVVPPWNFPLAIPLGGVVAALAAGNAVILKPAPEAVATAWALAEACWAAGLPKDLLQFATCADNETGRRLICHRDVDAVILTGSWDTARMFLGWRPDLPLHAETSGKNAIVVTATADLDAAIADLVRSAFGHAGQKCSAASLAIVEASVYDDERFRRQLADAARSLRPGAGWDTRTTIGPLIRRPEGALADALTRLEPGESWLVEPKAVDGHRQLFTPGVKLGVRPGSGFHLTECFGPVLGLMRASDLDEAITWQNAPAYGLTAGLHSLDPEEIAIWRDRVKAGNLYVNRHITGAIVRRQPFGGWKRSVVGPGAKAGGPNYVASLGRWECALRPEPNAFEADVRSALLSELAPSDPSGLAAEANILRYVPIRSVLVRAAAEVSDEDLRLALAAADAAEVETVVSSPFARAAADAVVESDDTLATRLDGSLGFEKLRLLGSAPDKLRLAAHDAGLWVDDLDVVAQPKLEALRWVREQAVSETRHRHGNLTSRHIGRLSS